MIAETGSVLNLNFKAQRLSPPSLNSKQKGMTGNPTMPLILFDG